MSNYSVHDEMVSDLQIKRLPDVTFTVNATERNYETFVGALKRGAKIVWQGQPCYVVSVKMNPALGGSFDPEEMGGVFEVIVRPTGPPRFVHRPQDGFLQQALHESAQQFRKAVSARLQKAIHASLLDEKNCYVTPAGARGYSSHHWPPRYGGIDYTIGFDPSRMVKAIEEAESFFDKHVHFIKEEPVKIRNKFYVAAPSVTNHSEQDQNNVAPAVRLARSNHDPSSKWTRHTLKDAITHAEQMLEDNPKMEHVAVVQIVRMVRRKKQPVIVETVR